MLESEVGQSELLSSKLNYFSFFKFFYLFDGFFRECNHDEVKVVVQLVSSIVKHVDCKDLKIGIITPYNRQKDIMKKKIDRE